MAQTFDNPLFFEELSVSLSGTTIFIDVDGTLVPDNESSFESAVVAQLRRLQKKNMVYVCTNSNNRQRNAAIERLLGISVLGNCRKPTKKILSLIGQSTRPLCVIGDKFLTDYLFAKRIHALFFFVRRKTSSRERMHIRLYNALDTLVAKLFVWLCHT